MDGDLYRHVAPKVDYDEHRLQVVFDEAERRRAQGQPYTIDEYEADQARLKNQTGADT